MLKKKQQGFNSVVKGGKWCFRTCFFPTELPL